MKTLVSTLSEYCFSIPNNVKHRLHVCSRHSDNEEHIYEEIIEESGEEETKEEVSEHSFLALISLERRKHLKFYGRTDWDYGNERF